MRKKNVQKNRNRGELPQLDKKHLQKPIGNIILNGKRFKAFLLRVGNKAKMSVLTTPYLM